jgi:hypothetical protein
VGLDSGKVHIYTVPKEKYNYMRYSEEEGLKSHTKRVMGLSYDHKAKLLYSIGEDGRFIVTTVNGT